MTIINHKHVIHFMMIFIFTGLPILSHSFSWIAYLIGVPVSVFYSTAEPTYVGIEICRALHRITAMLWIFLSIPFVFSMICKKWDLAFRKRKDESWKTYVTEDLSYRINIIYDIMRLIFLYHGLISREQWLARAAKEAEPSGTFWENGNLVFYSRQEGQYGLSYVTAVDLGTLFRANSTMIWLLIFAMALLDITVMGYIYLNVHYDSVFLGYLLGIIENVEKGDFKSAKAMKRPRFQGKDEYSIISTALENMSRALDEYILNEYRLKLKQQETAMRALQHQINPHFLYNTLEAIRAKALTEKNPKGNRMKSVPI